MMSEYLDNIKVGDEIYVDGYTSFCTTGNRKVTKIKTRYDKKTGEQYRLICVSDHKFDGRNGAGRGSSMYFILED